MPDTPGSPSMTVRGAITAADEALGTARQAHQITAARTALALALGLLDASERELGAFLDAEPYRLVLDPLPYEPPRLVLLPASA